MRHISRRVVVFVVCTLMLLLPLVQPVLAQNPSAKSIEPTAESMTADAIFMRPAGLIGMAIGACVWVVSLPFSLLGNNFGDATDALIVQPAKYTFDRPLGNI
jgi:hypothetical protein